VIAPVILQRVYYFVFANTYNHFDVSRIVSVNYVFCGKKMSGGMHARLSCEERELQTRIRNAFLK